jgi:hypothetical protein
MVLPPRKKKEPKKKEKKGESQISFVVFFLRLSNAQDKIKN